MIKFFSRIRQNLLSEGRTGKYLKYAIGEIALVVIGILIALSINNWNEDRKYKNLEFVMLTELKASLNQSLDEVDEINEYNNFLLESYSKIVNHISIKAPYNDSLDSHFAVLKNWGSPYFDYSAYETLKTRGVELISNSMIKKDIIRMYERDLEFLVNDYDKSEWNYNSSVVLPFLSKNFETTKLSFPKKAKPNDYNKILNDPEFKNILKELMQYRTEGIYHSNKLKLKLQKLIEDISKELEV